MRLCIRQSISEELSLKYLEHAIEIAVAPAEKSKEEFEKLIKSLEQFFESLPPEVKDIFDNVHKITTAIYDR